MTTNDENAQVLAPADRLIRRPELEHLTGLSRSNIYHRIHNDPDFPKPVRIGPNTVAWIESEARNWMQRCIAQSRTEAA